MSRIILLIGVGGAIGSICRYLLQQFAAGYFAGPFPYGTFVVNVLGCFLIGLIFGHAAKASWLDAELRFFLATGFCGGFTTFSTFSFETFALIKSADYATAMLYVLGSVVLGILATFGGMYITK